MIILDDIKDETDENNVDEFIQHTEKLVVKKKKSKKKITSDDVKII